MSSKQDGEDVLQAVAEWHMEEVLPFSILPTMGSKRNEYKKVIRI